MLRVNFNALPLCQINTQYLKILFVHMQEPTEVQTLKLELKPFRKINNFILSIALNPTILYMRFLIE